MSPITGKLRLAFSAIRDILRNNRSGYSAVWSSAFDWGSKGREFKSLYPDHFFAMIRGIWAQTQVPLSFFPFLPILSERAPCEEGMPHFCHIFSICSWVGVSGRLPSKKIEKIFRCVSRFFRFEADSHGVIIPNLSPCRLFFRCCFSS